MLAYGKNMGYWLEKGIYDNKWGNLGHEFWGKYFFAHELHELTRIVAMDKWRPGRSHELSLMQGVLYLLVLWRSAFQAHRPHLAYPGTAYPVTIASLCSAFQALVLNEIFLSTNRTNAMKGRAFCKTPLLST